MRETVEDWGTCAGVTPPVLVVVVVVVMGSVGVQVG